MLGLCITTEVLLIKVPHAIHRYEKYHYGSIFGKLVLRF